MLLAHFFGGKSARVLSVILGATLAIEGGLILAHAVLQHEGMHVVAFGAVELVSALLFVWPRTMRFGACGLVCASLVAAVFHVVEGEFPSKHLVAAIAVLIVVLRESGVSTHDERAAA
jgi:hypothetical protein